MQFTGVIQNYWCTEFYYIIPAYFYLCWRSQLNRKWERHLRNLFSDVLDLHCLVVLNTAFCLCCCLLVDAPTVSEGRDVGVTLGQRGVLECEADAVPEADFDWYKDDRR